ncbi:adenosylhomocysteinase [Nitrososphaera sp.]|uniref:adenosylhomocysteinase n=1 Tax=Nitrososphaera sp. TaxID=1971748 RepID=UPI0031703473
MPDSSLADTGKKRYEWARRMMSIVDKVAKDKNPLEGLRAGFCLHVTKETSVLVMAAKCLGAEAALCSANPLSAQEDIAAFLRSEGVSVYAWRNETQAEYKKCIRDVLAFAPDIITDDGGDLHYAAHAAKIRGIIGGTEETTSGVKRLSALERSKKLCYPVIAVNNARTKYLFDNRYGTGQSTLDGILRATGMLIAGSNVVVCGYGWVGKGVAARARGMGAAVTVTEVDPVKALEARMDGFSVMPLAHAAKHGDLFITCTGQTDVVRKEHFEAMKDGAVLANTGHFDVEIDVAYLYRNFRPAEIKQDVERFDINGKKLYLLSKGRVVNLVAAEGHPPEVMAMSFANQLASILHVAKNHKKMEKRVYPVPESIDDEVARLALESMNVDIDRLSAKQKRYQQG